MVQMWSQDKLLHYVGGIYDCVIEPARWEPFLLGLAYELDFRNGVLAVNALPTGHTLLHVPAGFDDHWRQHLRDYDADVAEAWGGVARIQHWPMLEPIIQSEVVPPEVLATNRYVFEMAHPRGFIDAAVIGLARDAAMLATLAFGRHVSAGPIGQTEIAILRQLAPHFARAVQISELLDYQTIAAATFLSVLESASAAIVLVDGQGSIVHANAAARTMLADGDPIDQTEGRLRMRIDLVPTALDDAIAAAALNEIDLSRRGMTGIPGRWSNGRPCMAHVLPLKRGTIRPGLTQRAAAAVFIVPSAPAPQFPQSALMMLFDLTPAESRIVEMIVQGQRQSEIAGTLGIAVSTVKTHLLRVFDKTGCRRQVDLVNLLAQLSLPL